MKWSDIVEILEIINDGVLNIIAFILMIPVYMFIGIAAFAMWALPFVALAFIIKWLVF